MDDSKLRLARLVTGYFQDELDPVEMNEFAAYLKDPVYADEIKALLDDSFRSQSEALDMPGHRKNRVLKSIFTEEESGIARQPVRSRWILPGAIAAAVSMLLLAVGLMYYNNTENKNGSADQEIAGARPGASLTLSDGKKISLANAAEGQLAEEAGVKISKSTDGQLIYEIKDADDQRNSPNVLSTERGQTYQLRLPDGTLVSLNAGSSLTYSSHLMDKGKRKVKLTGEGFFEVAKDKAHPFVVESKGQEVEVLGTHFNVKGYSGDQKILTTLVEGAVNIHYDHKEYLLKPGQQAVNDGKKVLVQSADIAEAIAWKEGYFRFTDTPVPAIMKELAQWYDIDVVYEGKFDGEGISGKISRNKPISDVLKMLENTGLVKFKVEGRRVTVLE